MPSDEEARIRADERLRCETEKAELERIILQQQGRLQAVYYYARSLEDTMGCERIALDLTFLVKNPREP